MSLATNNTNKTTAPYWTMFVAGLNIVLLIALFIGDSMNAQRAEALNNGAVSVSLITGQLFTLDSNKPCVDGPDAAYLGFRVTNTSGGTLTQLQASLSGLTGSFSLAGGQSAAQYIGTLAAAAYRDVYWFIQYSCTIGASNTFTVTVSDANSGTVSGSSTVTTYSSISANAGGQVNASTIGPGYLLGQIVPMTITYSFGNLNNDPMYIQPAGNPDFNAGCFQLVSTKVISMTSGFTGILVGDDQLYYASVKNNGSNNLIGVKYSLLYLCSGISTTARPYATEGSGNQIKYTGNYSTQLATTYPAGTMPFSMTKTVSPSWLPSTGGTVTYTVRITNSYPYDSQFNGISDTMSANITFGTHAASSQINGGNSSRTPSFGVSGPVRWDGQPQQYYTVPANSSITLVYTASVSGVVGTHVNTASANSGATQFGPSSASVRVLSPTAVRISNLSVSPPQDSFILFILGAVVSASLATIPTTYYLVKKTKRRHDSP